MTANGRQRPVGELLRQWRQRRRLSQLELANQAEISTRHLSFVETGRSAPSREMLLHLVERLEVPLRERNLLLLAAGFAPVYAQTAWDAPQLEVVRAAVRQVLTAHEPYPAVAVDRAWTLVAANASVTLLTDGVAPELLAPPANALRISLHPDGMAGRILNLGEWRARLLGRLRRQVALTGDPQLTQLHDELCGYPATSPNPSWSFPGRARSRSRCASAITAAARLLAYRRHLRHAAGRHRRRAGDQLVLARRPRDGGGAAPGQHAGGDADRDHGLTRPKRPRRMWHWHGRAPGCHRLQQPAGPRRVRNSDVVGGLRVRSTRVGTVTLPSSCCGGCSQVLPRLVSLTLCRSIQLLARFARVVLPRTWAPGAAPPAWRAAPPDPTSQARATDRALLAAISRVLPRARWSCFFVTPKTLLGWHRATVALSRNVPGKPSKVEALLHGRAPRKGRTTRPCP